MKTLFVNPNVIVSIFTVMLLIYGLQGISYGQEVPDNTVEFSDTNLAKAVRKALKLYVGDDVDILNIDKGELAELKYLEYDLDLDTPIHQRISNLTGLEHATGSSRYP